MNDIMIALDYSFKGCKLNNQTRGLRTHSIKWN